jgi:signal transduction histidine kinase
MRSRTVAIAAVGAVIVLLLVATLVAGGVFFLKSIRREQRESRKKTDFIDNVSHELRTPLAGIRLNAELLAENRIRDEERRRGALESILTESDRLERMVSELLDFGRLEKGTRRYSMEMFNLAEFASGVAEAEGVASISNGRARISVKGPGALVTADKDALRQIGVNLVTNAVKYSEDEIVVEVEGNEVRFMDRGRGIPPGCEERIFERFYRVDDSLTRRVNGSGLGLSIARALARGMGGEITYAHRPGGGSVFTLTLALADKHDGGADK